MYMELIYNSYLWQLNVATIYGAAYIFQLCNNECVHDNCVWQLYMTSSYEDCPCMAALYDNHREIAI